MESRGRKRWCNSKDDREQGMGDDGDDGPEEKEDCLSGCRTRDQPDLLLLPSTLLVLEGDKLEGGKAWGWLDPEEEGRG